SRYLRARIASGTCHSRVRPQATCGDFGDRGRKGPSMRVLAVDDDDDFLEVLRWQLEHAGIETRTASSGQVALQLLETERFDAALVDLVMPAMDGRALVRHIRARPRHADLPIVMMTHMSNIGRI